MDDGRNLDSSRIQWNQNRYEFASKIPCYNDFTRYMMFGHPTGKRMKVCDIGDA